CFTSLLSPCLPSPSSSPSLFFLLLLPPPPISTLFPYTTLFRSCPCSTRLQLSWFWALTSLRFRTPSCRSSKEHSPQKVSPAAFRSEEHTSELQSRFDLVCRLLLEKKKKKDRPIDS